MLVLVSVSNLEPAELVMYGAVLEIRITEGSMHRRVLVLHRGHVKTPL